MEPTGASPTWCLEGTYCERDLRAFAAFLARRVAGTKLWALGAFVLLPLLWAGDLRRTWPLMVPLAAVLVGFLLLLRFVLLPRKLYQAAIRLPGVFEPRRITVEAGELRNRSDAGGHVLRLEEIREVVSAPEHLFVMVAPKQGIPIPKAWIGDEARIAAVADSLLARRKA